MIYLEELFVRVGPLEQETELLREDGSWIAQKLSCNTTVRELSGIPEGLWDWRTLQRNPS
jgi:hypothetical protein